VAAAVRAGLRVQDASSGCWPARCLRSASANVRTCGISYSGIPDPCPGRPDAPPPALGRMIERSDDLFDRSRAAEPEPRQPPSRSPPRRPELAAPDGSTVVHVIRSRTEGR